MRRDDPLAQPNLQIYAASVIAPFGVLAAFARPETGK